MQATRKLSQFLSPYWHWALLAPLLMVLEVAMDLLQPRLIQQIIDDGVMQQNMSVVVSTGLWMVVVAVVAVIGGVGCAIFAVLAAQGLGADLRSTLFAKVQSFSFGNLDKLETGALITRLTNDVNQVQEVMMMVLRVMVRAPLLMVGSLFMAILTSPQLALLFVVLIPVVLVILARIINRSYPLFSGVQQRLDTLNTVMQENLAGVRVVKAFVRSRHEIERFGRANNQLMDQNLQAVRVVAVTMPLNMLVLNAGIVAALWIGGVQVNTGGMQVGQVVAFINYLMQALMSLVMVSMLTMRFARAEASSARILEVLASEPEIRNASDALTTFAPQGRVVFENVSFSYCQPVDRFYDIQSGSITIDGCDLRALPQDDLRRQLGIVLQDTFLFSGTVLDNIRYGRLDANEEEVIAAKLANADQFIHRLPHGYDTPLSERGSNLSQGQRQLLLIARAILADPRILILDEATSSVDTRTEYHLQDAMRRLMAGRTSFVIAHRLSTIRDADQILVINHGEIIERGTHSELLAQGGFYHNLYHSQFRATGRRVKPTDAQRQMQGLSASLEFAGGR